MYLLFWCVYSWTQRETLLRQLETNQLDMDATLEELCVQQETEDQNYEMYGLQKYSLCQQFLSLNWSRKEVAGF